MSSRRAFFLWVSVNVESRRNFRFALPIPLFILLGVSDIIEDAALFIPKREKAKRESKLSPLAVKGIMNTSARLLREIALNTEPFDLADIDVTEGGKRFVIKCLLK